MATSRIDRSEKLKKAGLFSGLLSVISVIVFFLWSGEPPFGIHASVIVPALVFSIPLLMIVAIGFFWPVFSGSLLTLGGVIWAAMMSITAFSSNSPWMSLLIAAMISIPCLTAGILLILSYRYRIKEEQEYGKYSSGS